MKKSALILFLAAQIFTVANANDDAVVESCRMEAEANGITGEDQEVYVQNCVEAAAADAAGGSMDMPAGNGMN